MDSKGQPTLKIQKQVFVLPKIEFQKKLLKQKATRIEEINQQKQIQNNKLAINQNKKPKQQQVQSQIIQKNKNEVTTKNGNTGFNPKENQQSISLNQFVKQKDKTAFHHLNELKNFMNSQTSKKTFKIDKNRIDLDKFQLLIQENIQKNIKLVNKEVFASKQYDNENPFLIGSLDYANQLQQEHKILNQNLGLDLANIRKNNLVLEEIYYMRTLQKKDQKMINKKVEELY